MLGTFMRAALASRERGQALILFAAGLAGLCGLVGLSVDVGHLVWTKADLQKVADAAALAGAQDLPATNTTPAQTSATTFANANGGGTLQITFSQTDKPNDTIQVVASRTVPFWFMKVLGINSSSVSAEAKVKAVQGKITGYNWASVAPFVIWGGTRQSMVNSGDNLCPLYTCVGKSYTFMDTGWMGASGNPTAPDWTANGSNNFKGDVNHGAGAPVNHVGEFKSMGGLGSVTAPAVGSIIVIPIVDRASGNANLRTFRVAAWALVRVDPGCRKQDCRGTILDPNTTAPPAGFVTGGPNLPPTHLQYLEPPKGRLIK